MLLWAGYVKTHWLNTVPVANQPWVLTNQTVNLKTDIQSKFVLHQVWVHWLVKTHGVLTNKLQTSQQIHRKNYLPRLLHHPNNINNLPSWLGLSIPTTSSYPAERRCYLFLWLFESQLRVFRPSAWPGSPTAIRDPPARWQGLPLPTWKECVRNLQHV